MKLEIRYRKGIVFMKKRVISMLAAIMLLLVCAVPVWADTDKEIQFTGHTFGESFLEAMQNGWINTIEFQHTPKASRDIVDPTYREVSWGLYSDSQVPYCFFSRADSQEVAGHYAGIVLRFYFPTEEAVSSLDLQKAIFYGGEYEFYEEDQKGIFDDLKQKLTSVYGDPSAEFTNPEEYWGKPTSLQKNVSEEDFNRNYQERIKSYAELSFVVWRQSGTDRQIILSYSRNQDGGDRTCLYYLDASADDTILQLYQQAGQDTTTTYSNSVNGL